MGIKGSMKSIMGLVVVDLFGLSLVPTVANAVAEAAGNENVTGAAAVLLPLATLGYIGALVGFNIAVLYKAFT